MADPRERPVAGDDEAAYRAVLDRLNDGRPLDWQRLEREHPALAPRLQRLRRVEEIGSAFRAAATDGDETQEARAEQPEPAAAWGHLELRGRIGQGSFGEVWRAWDPVLEREVALKLARDVAAPERERFLREGRQLAQVEHEGVVRVHGAAVHDDRAGVWMDLAEGRSLEERLRQDGRFAEQEVVDVGRQLCAALAAIHARGLVHGDVKAANVLRRDGGRLVLADFGSSLDLRHGPTEQRSASPLAAAPEVLRGEPADGRSDLYSLGVLLYRLLTGRPPHGGDSVEAILRHQEEGATPLADLRPEVRPHLAATIERALEVDRERRWPSATAMASSLVAAADATPVPPRLGAPARVAAVVALLALAAGAAWWLAGGSPPSPAVTGPGTQGAGAPATTERPVGAGPSAAGEGATVDPPGAAVAAPPRITLHRADLDRPLRSGDELTVGDALHLRVEDSRGGLWLYLVNEDASGRAYTLFPLPGIEPGNPLPAGDLRLPGTMQGREQDWVVTSAGGTESFLLVASSRRLPNLESELEALALADPSRRPEQRPSFGGTTRGVGGLEPAADAAEPGGLLRLRELAAADDPSGPAPLLNEIISLRGAMPPSPDR